jgi:ABC-type dipeptide/oligopeptide/nickel transport system ATPase component
MTIVHSTPSADVSTASAAPVLLIEDLHTSFVSRAGVAPIVKGVSLKVEAGRTLVVLGESGSGKSVTARSILRLYGPKARHTGRVLVGGTDVLAADEKTLSRLRGPVMALVPQDPNGSLDPLRRVRSQLDDTVRRAATVRLSRAARTARILDLLTLVGIRDPQRVAKSYPHELSGGMRQRIAIALAVSRDPQLLIADEPTTALDPTVQKQILELFAELQRRMGTALVFVTHDVDVARAIADDVAVMFNGRLVEYGPASEVLTSPSHAYTRALLAAVPTRDSVRGHLPTVAETMAAEGIDFAEWSAS